jgi:hypothetical protein
MVEKMGKIIGRILLLLSFFMLDAHARISMEVRTENGQSNQVIVGQPFIIDVVIEDLQGSVQAPTIKGLDAFVARRTGMYMSSINGRSTTRYSYQVRIDKLGSYILGPAVLTHQQQEHISNKLQIYVVKDLGVAAQKNQAAQATSTKAFLRLMIDAETAVVGQKIDCVLRFYYQDPSLSLHNIGIPEMSGFDIKDVSPLETGVAEIDGAQYRYAQWQWDMYPTKPGEFIIPAYHADYDIPVKDNNVLSSFFMFVGNRADRKRVYSNAVTVKVLPLPRHDGPVHAVGSFERVSAEIKPGIAKEGEGMVLVVEIEGMGNLSAIEVPKLVLPDALKYYDSNNTIVAPRYADELPKKRFEFIVQGMKPGDYEIPEQLFTYFDVEKYAYTTLKTSPLAVSIMPGLTNTKKIDYTALITPGECDDNDTDNDEIADINFSGSWHPVAQRKPLPWWLFFVLTLMPCVYGLYPIISENLIAVTGNSARLMRRRAFKHARKKIALCSESGDATKLHSIFEQLFQQLESISGMPKLEQSTEWNNFFERIMHVAYARGHGEDMNELCRMAKQWLDRLEKM